MPPPLRRSFVDGRMVTSLPTRTRVIIHRRLLMSVGRCAEKDRDLAALRWAGAAPSPGWSFRPIVLRPAGFVLCKWV